MAVRSLYEQYGVVAPGQRPGPGTLETKQIETVDNDVSVALAGALDAAHPTPPPPGTRMTATVETVDNDAAIVLDLALAAPAPRRPGTALTATVETSDEDATAALGGVS